MINIFFDMDGTLIDSANAISCAVNEIHKNLNLEKLAKEKIIQIINTPNIDWAKELYNIKDFNHSNFKKDYEQYFIKHYKKSVVLFDGIKELLIFLKNKNCFLAIATNAPQSSLKNILQKHEILSYFDKILGVSSSIKPKPHPMMLELLKSQAPYKTSIFIGDSQKDQECAKNANLTYFHAKWYQKNLKENEFSNTNELKSFLQRYL
ncbi:HAD family hydrolase [Campylobacter hepaticus]|uniref:phosphoglycolate phosphatase n=1 Tax=Campylobacter hepaticus TaxID=1813019 RepID=A0A6A7JR16_9BACT|nr:HAD family hydrolase [Campylobacter hepaticus]AXP08296.1 HAD family hydrolase [Campylobacter hepaticus]MPV53534.1 HAD-IA family hydrolase [Campylobacter hepaticus]MPV62052.1 HAD-IA family hydrolase [Campylobacter hepaticus]MPV76846.1 HAD-IA family hydrolase [Campylobacter hepaticus]MPV78192.1 HAD-IA family hydrolase [Campylobacter hepaticus]